MLEKTVEAYLVERVRALGGTAYKFTSPARASVPDRIVILPPGRIFFVELKRPGGKLTRGQEREHEHLRWLGADVRMLDSIGAINAFLNEVHAVAAAGTTCKGKNCGATDGISHSPECVAEHEAAVSGAVAADGATQDAGARVSRAEYETAVATLRHVIDCLRKTGSYTDEEGEATDYLEPLLIAAVSPATADERAARDDGFFAGICVALQVLTTHGQGVIWKDIVKACGVDDLLQYAAHIEPEEWDLAGFKYFARDELGRRKPAARKVSRASQAAAPADAHEPFPYQKTFDAIAAATSITAGGHVSISVEAFRKAFGAIPADAGEAADAARYRWLQRQRANVWHEIADMPINRTNEHIDAARAQGAQGGKGGEA